MSPFRGYASESDGEEMAGEDIILPQDLPGRGNVKTGQSSVRLSEVRVSTGRTPWCYREGGVQLGHAITE